MNTWLTKWRISSAVDDRKPLPPAVKSAVAQSAEVRQFAEAATALELALTHCRPMPVASSALHVSIMRAVQSAEPVRVFAWPEYRSRLLPAATLALLLLLSVFGAAHFPKRFSVLSPAGGSPSLAVAGSALETSCDLMRAMPDAALSPLNHERLWLDHDLVRAQEFLLASLP